MTKQTHVEATRLLAEAAEWRLLATLLSRPTAAWREEIDAARDATLRVACEEALEQASEGLYHSLFGPGGPAAPRETSHRTTLQLGYMLSELETFYSAFGYVPDAAEPPDHVAVEADFVAYLKAKRALAVAQGQGETAELTAAAERSFIAEHASRIAEPLSRALEHSGVSYLAAVSQALLERVGPPRAAPRPDLAEKLVTIEAAELTCDA